MTTTERYREALERIVALIPVTPQQHDALVAIDSIAREALESQKIVPDNRPELTARQAEVEQFIRWFTRTKGYGPSVRDICDRFEFRSPNAAMQHLNALRSKGYLESTPGSARSFVLLEAS